MRAFTYARPTSVEDALARHRATPATDYLAGGTTLVDLVKLDVMKPQQVVDLNRIPGLDRIETLPDGALKIGALVRNSDLARHPEVRSRYPVLAEALLSGASAGLRNMATTAGNLLQRTRCIYYRDNVSACNKRQPGTGCSALEGHNRGHAILGTSEACIATHPSDMCVGLAVLDGEVLVRGSAGGERRIPYLDFHRLPGDTPHLESALQPGDLVTAVVLPPPPAGARSWYLKLRDRESYEFALSSVAAVVVAEGGTLREARLALGGVGTKPWRSREAEQVLRGAPATEETFRRAADAALQPARPHKHNAFKVELTRRAIVRALTLVTEGQPAVRTT